MASRTTTRRKHNATVAKRGREIADDPARVKKRGSGKYRVSSDSKRRYCMVLGAFGRVRDCPDQQGRGGIIPARGRGGRSTGQGVGRRQENDAQRRQAWRPQGAVPILRFQGVHWTRGAEERAGAAEAAGTGGWICAPPCVKIAHATRRARPRGSAWAAKRPASVPATWCGQGPRQRAG